VFMWTSVFVVLVTARECQSAGNRWPL